MNNNRFFIALCGIWYYVWVYGFDMIDTDSELLNTLLVFILLSLSAKK